MNEERIFTQNQISLSNLEKLSQRQVMCFEERACELAFVADEISVTAKDLISGGMSIYEVLMQLSEELSLPVGNTVGENVIPLSNKSSTAAIAAWADMACISELLFEKLRLRGVSVSESDFLRGGEVPQVFTYVKNSLSDEAYDVFSQDFSDPRVTYSESFKDACIAVAEGKVGYCILPFEEKGGVRIPGIADLISMLDLKVVSVTPVFGFEGNADMKYALVASVFTVPDVGEDIDRYFEIKLPASTDIGLPMLLSVADSFDVSVYQINTMYAKEDPENLSYSIVFRDGGSGFVPMLIFLTLFVTDYTPMGIYKNLE